MTLRSLISSLVFVVLLNGCASRAWHSLRSDSEVRPGDLVVVQSLGQSAPEIRSVVDNNGDISLPVAGTVHHKQPGPTMTRWLPPHLLVIVAVCSVLLGCCTTNPSHHASTGEGVGHSVPSAFTDTDDHLAFFVGGVAPDADRAQIAAGLLRAHQQMGAASAWTNRMDLHQIAELLFDTKSRQGPLSSSVLSFGGKDVSTETAGRVLAELRQVGLRVDLARLSSGEPSGPSYRCPAPERFIEIHGDVQAPGEKPFLLDLTAAHAIQLGGGLRHCGPQRSHRDSKRQRQTSLRGNLGSVRRLGCERCPSTVRQTGSQSPVTKSTPHGLWHIVLPIRTYM